LGGDKRKASKPTEEYLGGDRLLKVPPETRVWGGRTPYRGKGEGLCRHYSKRGRADLKRERLKENCFCKAVKTIHAKGSCRQNKERQRPVEEIGKGGWWRGKMLLCGEKGKDSRKEGETREKIIPASRQSSLGAQI